MIRRILLLLVLCSWPILAAPLVEIYIYNTTGERLTYTQNLPNGDSKTGEVKERSAYSPGEVTIREENTSAVTCRLGSESGKSAVEIKGTDSQVFVLVLKDGAMSVVSGAWTATNGQSQKREIRFLNATGRPLNFDIIGEKEIGKASIQQGHSETYPAKSGLMSLRFESGQREENQFRPGEFWLLYTENDAPDKIQCKNLGHLTPPISR